MKFFFVALQLLIASPVYCQWTRLFNGRDLDGWKQLNGQAKYEVTDQVIVGTTVANTPNSFLVTTGTYRDFILELEFKLEGNTNSGIQVRSESSPAYQNGRVYGYQVEIDPSARAWTGGLYDEGRREWLYPLEFNPSAKGAYRQNDWNKLRIECIGPVIRSWVNGVSACYVADNLTEEGFIGLQVHSVGKTEEAGARIMWRDIRIQTQNLVPSPADGIFAMNLLPNVLTEQETRNGWELLWDGHTTKGWRRAYSDRFPEKGWEITDGTLGPLASGGGESAHGGDIVSQDEFSAFDLQFEFRLTEGTNSGVKYFVTEKEGNTGSAIGLEYQILDDEKHPDAKMGTGGNRTQASLYDLIPSAKVSRGIHKIGEWNQGRIVVYPDNRVEHWLNGYKVVEYRRGSPEFLALVAKSKYVPYENFGMAKKGRILLQDHGGRVFFRSIKIRKLE